MPRATFAHRKFVDTIMSEFLIEFIVTERRFVRVQAPTESEARESVSLYWEQQGSEKMGEMVMIVSSEEDK